MRVPLRLHWLWFLQWAFYLLAPESIFHSARVKYAREVKAWLHADKR